MIARRAALSGAIASTLVSPAFAQIRPGGRMARVGWLALNSAGNPHQLTSFRAGLVAAGWREGDNLTLHLRDAQGSQDRLQPLAEELVAEGMDVIVAGPTQSTRAAMASTRSIPIVFPVAADPVGSGLVASLSNPGGNVTGLSLLASDLVAKCLDILVQIAPDRRRVAVFWVPGGHSPETDSEMLRQAENAGRMLGLTLTFAEIRTPDAIEVAMESMAVAGVRAICVLPYALLFQHRARIIALVDERRFAAVYPWREFVDTGGLVSYGANTADLYRRSAGYVDRILRGGRPSDLAVEQPTKFELVLSLRAARSAGLDVSPLLLARADEVIE